PTAAIGTWQDRVGTPPRCTVQAPHWPMPQPYLVPMSPIVSRSTQSSGVSGSTSTSWDCPFTETATMLILTRGLPATQCLESRVTCGQDTPLQSKDELRSLPPWDWRASRVLK